MPHCLFFALSCPPDLVLYLPGSRTYRGCLLRPAAPVALVCRIRTVHYAIPALDCWSDPASISSTAAGAKTPAMGFGKGIRRDAADPGRPISQMCDRG